MQNVTKTAVVAVIATAGVFSLSWGGLFSGSCERPLTYHIGSIDNSFDIATSTARTRLEEAEEVWENAADMELFVYDPEADFTVNFIFDERQRRTNAANEYESELSELEMSHQEVIDAYEEVSATYEQQLAAHKERQQQYESDLAAYNDRVARWNDRGGAPDDVHQELIDERQRLNSELDDLERRQQELEEIRREVNRLASRGNSLAREYNETASTYSQRFGESQEFDQATYENNKINVYQFEQADDLRLALAHEFGHALGIGHVEGSDSIMYYLMEGQSLRDLSLSQEDKAAFSNVCSDV